MLFMIHLTIDGYSWISPYGFIICNQARTKSLFDMP